MTILGRVDLPILEAYVRVYSEWRREDPKSRRWLWLIDRLTTLGIQLGLTPAARLRMDLPEGERTMPRSSPLTEVVV